jgi:hypothetical protein
MFVHSGYVLASGLKQYLNWQVWHLTMLPACKNHISWFPYQDISTERKALVISDFTPHRDIILRVDVRMNCGHIVIHKILTAMNVKVTLLCDVAQYVAL